MPSPRLIALFLSSLLCSAALRAADAEFPPHPDSLARPGIPKGDLVKFDFASPKIFPGTTREVTLYIPRQYDPAKPACVYVNQDGVQWGAPVVFDNLIARGDIPVLIGVFVRPGVVKAANGAAALDRFNRSLEYDGLGDSYARFLLEELLPAVETKLAPDGRAIRLSRRGADRAIGGSSSGAIAAWTAAWERPDAFTRVFSNVGTFVGIRGGDVYPTLIRKYEPKPIRVFLVDGSNDNNLYAGDWWMANQTMQRALTYAGYEVRHVWGDGGHNARHGTAVFPDAMRWLWSGWPQPVKAGRAPLERLGPILIPGEDWQLVGEGYRLSEGAVVNAKGEVFFTDIPASKAYKIGPGGKPVEFIADTKRANGQAFGPDGRLYAVATGARQVLAYGADQKPTVIAGEIAGNDLVVAYNGNVYVTNPPAGSSNEPSRIWLIKPDGAKQIVDTGLGFANGIALSPDQSLLYVADYRSHWVYSYVVQADGTLAHKQRFYWLHAPDTDDQSYADGLKVDRNGNLWVATRLGIQICDQAGRVNFIIPTPNGRCTNLVFGGEKFDTLYATCNDKVYKRKLNVTGANAWDTPNKPAAPRL
ncbi:MAG: SMP-30/gluconolactonase/LRE family protein [Opitutaceae bacterium]|nr:SMP-30/gluconolactonase/LRE family protein [Opitutaceae bacterium]